MGAVELGYKGALAILIYSRQVFQYAFVKGKEREVAWAEELVIAEYDPEEVLAAVVRAHLNPLP